MNTAIAEDGLESLSRDPYLALPLESRFIRFEDIVLDPEEVMRSLGAESAVSIGESTKPKDSRTLEDLQAYYREERWREQLEGIAEEPDWALFGRFGYSR